MSIQKIIIRSEQSQDISAIFDLTAEAFKTLEISSHTEQFIVNALRDAKVLTISLVAELDNKIVGHIAFSPITISDGTTDWYGLGPVSALPAYQRQGIGKALIKAGLEQLQQLKAKGCCLVGHPEYYGQFGFKNVSGLGLIGIPEPFFFALSFDENMPQGNVSFHSAFQATAESTT